MCCLCAFFESLNGPKLCVCCNVLWQDFSKGGIFFKGIIIETSSKADIFSVPYRFIKYTTCICFSYKVREVGVVLVNREAPRLLQRNGRCVKLKVHESKVHKASCDHCTILSVFLLDT